MRKWLALPLAAVVSLPATSVAQEDRTLLGPPAFVLQPGVVKSMSRGAGTELNARFLTVIPTAVPRTALLAIVQWTPFQSADDGDGRGAYTLNAPSLVYGANVLLASTRSVSLFGDALFSYSPSASNPPGSAYTHKFLVSGDVFVHVGSLLGLEGTWSRLSIYGFAARVLTGLDDPDPPSHVITSRDRMVVLAGFSLPFAPW